MTPPTKTNPTVALVRSDNRRGAVAEALALVAASRDHRLGPEVALGVDLGRSVATTHADALAATLDAVLDRRAGGGRVTVLAPAGVADRVGYRRMSFGRPVAFDGPGGWREVSLIGPDGTLRLARVADPPGASARVTLAVLRTDPRASASPSLLHLASWVHPDDRAWAFGDPLGSFGPLGRLRARVLGRLQWLRLAGAGRSQPNAWRTLGDRQVAELREVDRLARNLATLAGQVRPDLGVVDGYQAIHREGVVGGEVVRLGVALAGSDPVAVDAVAAAVLGFDPMAVAPIRLAHDWGLGVADLGRIQVVGDPIVAPHHRRVRVVPPANFAVARHWGRLAELTAGAAAGAPPIGPRRTSRPRKLRRIAQADQSVKIDV